MGPKWGRSMYQALEQVEVVQAPNKIALSGFARDGRVQRGIQDHFGLLKRRQLRACLRIPAMSSFALFRGLARSGSITQLPVKSAKLIFVYNRLRASQRSV